MPFAASRARRDETELGGARIVVGTVASGMRLDVPDQPFERRRERCVPQVELHPAPLVVELRHPGIAEWRARGEQAALGQSTARERARAKRNAEKRRDHRQELVERDGLVLGQVVVAADPLPAGEKVQHRGDDVVAVHVPEPMARPFGHEDRSAVPAAPDVARETPEVIAPAVHHREPERGHRKPLRTPGAVEHVLGCALLDAVAPIPPVGPVARGFEHDRAVVVFLPKRPRQPRPYEIDLTARQPDETRGASGASRRTTAAASAPV